MKCRGCGGPTIEKNTKVGVCYECAGECVDPKKPQYKLATWPPKATNAPAADGILILLTELLRTLQNIDRNLSNGNKFSRKEMNPDEEVPF